MPRFAQMVLANGAPEMLTYVVPAEMQCKIGSMCLVPLRGRTCVALLLAFCDKPEFKCLEVATALNMALPESVLALVGWVSRYYLAPLGLAVTACAPGFVWKLDKIADRDKRLASRDKRFALKKNTVLPEQILHLTQEQTAALDAIHTGKRTTLLQGVTGSGKTEVYLAAVKRTLDGGRTAIVLVPEIALTPQMEARFRHHFGDQLAVLHSGLAAGLYEYEWFQTLAGRKQVVLGVRTAVFAPLQNVGIVIVDEEHDQSYKSSDQPCIQARDVAVKRCALEDAYCVLGSATPSLESYQNVLEGRYDRALLKSRFSNSATEFQFCDTRDQGNKKKLSQVKAESSILNAQISVALSQCKKQKNQSMVILNRRGFAHFSLCTGCGETLKCPNCAVSTTLHKSGRQELCHYCGFSRVTLVSCPSCGVADLTSMGLGTQNMETLVQEACPELSVDRLDRDVLTSQTRLSGILNDFQKGKTDCLVGTQMLSKGHDFPNVTLVVLLHLEECLFLPDFRSAERTYALLSQSAGRAGRGQDKGTVLIQTFQPEHPIFGFAVKGDVEGFLQNEMRIRQLTWQPPVCRNILIAFQGTSESNTIRLAESFRSQLTDLWKQARIDPAKVRIVGPFPATIEKIKNNFRFHILIAAERSFLPEALVPFEIRSKSEFARQMRIDVDPYTFM